MVKVLKRKVERKGAKEKGFGVKVFWQRCKRERFVKKGVQLRRKRENGEQKGVKEKGVEKVFNKKVKRRKLSN